MQTFSNIELLGQLAGYAFSIVLACSLIWLSLFVFNRKLKSKYKKRKSRRARLLCYAALFVAVLIDIVTPGHEYWWLYPALVSLSLFLYLLAFRKGTILLKVFWWYTITVYLVISLATAFFLVASMPSLSLPIFGEIPRTAAILAFSLPLFAAICFLLARQTQLATELSLTTVLVTVLVPALCCVVFAFLAQGNLIRGAHIWASEVSMPPEQTIGAAVLFAVNILVLMFHDYLLTKAAAGLDEQSLLRESELRRIHYEELQSLYGATRTWRHDYANHIQAIEGLVFAESYEELATYIGELKGSLGEINFRITSGSELLDAFLSTKATYAESLGIEFDVEIGVDMGEVPLTPTEITSLIGNLLDNAIESCQRVEDKSIQAKTQMKISRSKDQLVIYAKNTMSGAVEFDDEGNLVTSKQRGDHGIGTRQIDALIKKYKGSVDRTVDADSFETFATLPLKAAHTQAHKDVDQLGMNGRYSYTSESS